MRYILVRDWSQIEALLGHWIDMLGSWIHLAFFRIQSIVLASFSGLNSLA